MAIFNKDPCGIICIGITFSAILYADYVVIFHIIMVSFYNSLWGSLHLVLFNIIIALLVASHLRAVTTDPGLVPIPSSRLDFSEYHENAKERGENEEGQTLCTKCEVLRPPRSHHCRICQRCIRRMDHHCPWVNNCVGEFNQKFFIQFLVYVGILSMYASGLVVFAWTAGADCKYCPTDTLQKQSRILHSVLLMLESLLFGMFILAILIDQLSSIFSDETAIEHVKKLGRHRPRKPKMTLLREVFGKGSIISWLNPCTTAKDSRDFTISSQDYHV